MSEIEIEELSINDVPESERSEFIVAEDIPIVSAQELSDTEEGVFNYSDEDSDYEADTTSDYEEETKISRPFKRGTKSHTSHTSKKRQAPAGTSEKSQSMFLKKFMSGEITYSEYAKCIGKMSVEDDTLEDLEDQDSSENSDADAKDSTMSKIKKHTKKSEEKAATHFAKKTKRSLPPALQGLMGQANLCFARNDIAMAEKLCLEIIRQEPMAAEPYLTLSQIYETTDEEKYHQLMLIAAHVNSTVLQWTRIAEIFHEKGNLKQASFCYAKATRCDPKNLSLRLKRLEILKELGDEKHVLHCTYCMLSFIPKDQHEFLISQAKYVAQKYHQEGLITKSLDAMLKAYSKVPEHFSTEEVYDIIELLMNNKQYRKCLNILVFHSGLNVKITQKSKDVFEYSDIYIPNDMLPDLRTKMCICLINLKAFNLIEILLQNVTKYIDAESAGDCYLEIAEALMTQKHFSDALHFLDPILQTPTYSAAAAVWLHHADCLRSTERFSEAIVSYKKVVELSEGHIETRLTIAALLKKEGQMEEALEALAQDPQIEKLHTELLKEKCLLLKEMGRIEEYLQHGYMMLLRHCVHYRSRQEVQIVSNFTKTNDRLNELRNLRKNRDEVLNDVDTPEFDKVDNEPTLADDWNLFIDLIATAWQNKKYVHLQKLAFAGMSSRRLQSHVREIDFIGAVACLYNKEETFGYNKLREFLNADKDKSRFWNFFNLIVYVTQDCRYHRFVTRLFDHDRGSNVPPMVYMMIANYCLMSNSYKYALNHYDEIYRRFQPPLVAMILSILYSQIANQKFTTRKQSLIVQAMNYMQKYQQTREPEAMAEIFYNTGRLYHQLGIVHVAKSFYEKALKETNALIEENKDLLDLKMEIAYNLHVIYKSSGNKEMARKLLYDHIVV